MNSDVIPFRLTTGDRNVGLAIAGYVLLLVLLPLVLSDAAARHVFSEEGPFEQLAIVGWLLAALTVVVRIRPLGGRAWAFAMVFMLFAAREADLHKAFTADSLLKTNYYRHAVAPIEEKLMAGMVALAAIVLFAYAGFVILRFLFRQRGWRSRAGFWLLLGITLVVAGKMVDRAPAVLEVNFGIVLSPLVGLYVATFEEGLEMIHPLILVWSIWISQADKRYLS